MLTKLKRREHSDTAALQPPKKRLRRLVKSRKLHIAVAALLVFHIWLHLANPYAKTNFVQQPYTTELRDGNINYTQHHSTFVLSDPLSDLLGYYRQGFLIVQNTFFGGQPASGNTPKEIIDHIHEVRFDPTKPYLISGDQFSVLYPRNLGVFYNQVLDPNTAHSQKDWENRQRIYLQSALFAIDGLSAAPTPRTTLIPIGPNMITATTVHPGDVGSDAVYGTLYALDKLSTPNQSKDGHYRIATEKAAMRVVREKRIQLATMVAKYVETVRDKKTKLVRTDIHPSSARDGVSRKSSFYDNVIFWKTLQLANKLGVYHITDAELSDLHQRISKAYWNEKQGYYNNDRYDPSFTGDWLIGYVTGFFDLTNRQDRERTQRTIDYIRRHKVAEPFPLRYQVDSTAVKMPLVIKWFVPSYGADAIWSYWGAQYITLLTDMSEQTSDQSYRQDALRYVKKYNEAIVRDNGFAETFDPEGNFLRSGLFYKSIRITGWVVQYEHAIKQLEMTGSSRLLDSPKKYDK